MNWLTGHMQSQSLHHLSIPSSVLQKGIFFLIFYLIPVKIWNVWCGASLCFRREPWVPPFLNPGSGMSEGRGGLVFHMALLNGWFSLCQIQHEHIRRHPEHNFTLPYRAINRCSQDECHPPGLFYADMGSSGAEVPSTIAAAHGGMCGSLYPRAAAWQPGVPPHWQQRVGFHIPVSLYSDSTGRSWIANLRF